MRILGTRGIPAQHGGFETFAESFAIYMADRGHEVTVYCQTDQRGRSEDTWKGVHRVMLYGSDGPAGTILFDLKSVLHSLQRSGVILTLGYNTALFSLLFVLARRPSLMNMDGLEWMRLKWSTAQRVWLRLNEFAGAHLSTHLIADHPEIAKHLANLVPAEKISVIPYGAQRMEAPGVERLQQFGCKPFSYALCIARAEPENSILEIVQAFSRRPHGYRLIVLGRFAPDRIAYHRQVLDSASDEVIFPGAIYDRETIQALRQYAKFYIHGHRVGGTNPSLVEALAAGSPILAHRNRFNAWVAGTVMKYFDSEAELADLLTQLEDDPEELDRMRAAAMAIHQESFHLEKINQAYESLLERYAV